MAARRRSAGFSAAHFPYVRFHRHFYPLIPVSLHRRGRAVNTFALIDSGASVSVFRPEIAKELGLASGKKAGIRLGTATGGVHIETTGLNLEIAGLRFRATVGFPRRAAAGFNILGREGFFGRFNVCFDERNRRVILTPNRK